MAMATCNSKPPKHVIERIVAWCEDTQKSERPVWQCNCRTLGLASRMSSDLEWDHRIGDWPKIWKMPQPIPLRPNDGQWLLESVSKTHEGWEQESYWKGVFQASPTTPSPTLSASEFSAIAARSYDAVLHLSSLCSGRTKADLESCFDMAVANPPNENDENEHDPEGSFWGGMWFLIWFGWM